MKTNHVFEQWIRGREFADLDAARAAVRTHPLVGDYVLDMLVTRGVVAVRETGAVAGVKALEVPMEGVPKKYVAEEWSDKWPERSAMREALRLPAGFLELKGRLIAAKQNPGHWRLLHALWYMQEAGEVQQDDRKVWHLVNGVMPVDDVKKRLSGKPAKPVMPTLVELEKAAMALLEGSEGMTRKEIALALNAPETAVSKVLAAKCAAGLVADFREPNSKAWRYKIREQEAPDSQSDQGALEELLRDKLYENPNGLQREGLSIEGFTPEQINKTIVAMIAAKTITRTFYENDIEPTYLIPEDPIEVD